MARVSFTGGPLHGQEREMDVYVAVIPVYHYNGKFYGYGNDETGHPRAYYSNVNSFIVNEQLRNSGFTHYVFHIDGKRVPPAGEAAAPTERGQAQQQGHQPARMAAERPD